MDAVFQHIEALSAPGLSWNQAFRRMAVCIREICGDCGVAMLSSAGLASLNMQRGYQLTAFCQQSGLDGPDECRTSALGEHPVCSGRLPDLLLDSKQVVTIPRIDPELLEECSGLFAGYRALIAVPLLLDGKIERWLLILGHQQDQFSTVDIDKLSLVANLAATYVARVADMRRLKEASHWIQQELDDIARLQQMLMPDHETPVPGVRLAKRFEACEQAGGDYYDLVVLSDLMGRDSSRGRQDVWGVMIADAAGHGAAAAVEIAMLDAILRTFPGDESTTPADVLNYVNPYLFTRMTRGTFITAFAAGYNRDSHRLLYAVAGHPPALLWHAADQRLEVLDEHAGIPLGVDKSYTWQFASTDLNPGDMLVLYTDGVTESRSFDGEAFGSERLVAQIGHHDSPASLLKAIEAELAAHTGGMKQQDDQTLLVLQVTD